MPSSFTNNLGVELPADGELDGVWGEVVNDNMSIVDRATHGSLALTLSGTSSTLTTTDGALSDGQYKLLVLGGSPSGTHTITLTPNDSQKIYVVRNTTSQSVVVTQGSGGNATIAAGDSAIIYANGSGTGATVVNVTPELARSTVAFTGGTMNNVVIGGTTPAAGTFTTLSGTTARMADGSQLTPSISFTGDTDTGFFRIASNRIGISTGNDLIANFQGVNDGVLNMGDHAARNNIRTSSTSSNTPRIQIEGSGGNTGMSIVRNTTSANFQSFLVIGRTRGAADGENTAVLDNDLLGILSFNGSDGTSLVQSAFIRAEVDGTPATDSIPSALSFRTTPPAGTEPVEILLIDSAGTSRFFGNVRIDKAFRENVFALTGTTPALNPSNGTIQTWTLSGNSSPTDSLAAGESMTLMIDDGTAFTITWPSVTWKTDGGFAPTLLTSGLTAIVLWKVGSTLYGARVGNA